MTRPTRSVSGPVVLALLLVASLIAPRQATAQSTPGATPAAPASEATWAVADCPFTVPGAFVEGDTLTCGYTTVPLFHDEPDGDQIRLFGILLSATSVPVRDTPLVFLAGGPGQGGSSQLAGFLPASDIYGSLLEQQDIILLDQRGTGFSEPGLYCPEDGGPAIPGLDPQDLLASDPGEAPGVIDPSAGTAETDVVADCRRALEDQGVQLDAFTSAESAADVNDVRSALGYDQIDIYGVSYGSRLGLVLERDYPGIVRAAVLASTLPPQVNQFAEQVVAFDAALGEAFRQCGADPDCAAANPKLSATFDQTVEQLDASPIVVDLIDLQTGALTNSVPMDGTLFAFVIYESLFISALTPGLPALVTAASVGNGNPFGPILSVLSIALTSGFATGLLYTIDCAEEVSFATAEDTDAVLSAADVRPALLDGDAFNIGPSFEAACDVWDVVPADAVENEPVTSDVPTLVVSGEFDPVTPPSNGELTAETLENGFAIELPAVGHDPLASAGPCGMSLAAAFLLDPSQAPDTACTAGLVVDFSPVVP